MMKLRKNFFTWILKALVPNEFGASFFSGKTMQCPRLPTSTASHLNCISPFFLKKKKNLTLMTAKPPIAWDIFCSPKLKGVGL